MDPEHASFTESALAVLKNVETFKANTANQKRRRKKLTQPAPNSVLEANTLRDKNDKKKKKARKTAAKSKKLNGR